MDNIEYRTFDGSNNNITNPQWGKAGTPLRRITTPSYGDGISTLAQRGESDINPRSISNRLCKQDHPTFNKNGLSDFTWAWGQFLDHEMDLSDINDSDSADINVPSGDEQLPGGGRIPFNRSVFDPTTGESVGTPREQTNVLSSYIDASNVYGSNILRASALRAFDGTGRLKTSKGPTGEFLPYNIAGLPNAELPGTVSSSLFIAGDIRANEHAILTSLHTLFMREHNRLCIDIIAHDPGLLGDDETIYQQARKIVGGLMQAVTYNEFLPALLGSSALKPYAGYDDQLNASISNVFANVCYRLGHSMLSSDIALGVQGRKIPLRDAFFIPNLVIYNGIDPFLSGLTTQVMQNIDTTVVEDVRSFLFGPPNPQRQILLDLPAINIQRGRDHGLPDYNQCRIDLGLTRYTSFADITSDSQLQQKLENVYSDINNIDPWIGCLAEDHLPGANVGEFVLTVLADQFTRLRDGDRFWYEVDAALSDERKEEIHNTCLTDIIYRNTNNCELPQNVFFAQDCRVAWRKAS